MKDDLSLAFLTLASISYNHATSGLPCIDAYVGEDQMGWWQQESKASTFTVQLDLLLLFDDYDVPPRGVVIASRRVVCSLIQRKHSITPIDRFHLYEVWWNCIHAQLWLFMSNTYICASVFTQLLPKFTWLVKHLTVMYSHVHIVWIVHDVLTCFAPVDVTVRARVQRMIPV